MTLMACYGCPDCVVDLDGGDDEKARDAATDRGLADGSVGDAADASLDPADAADGSDAADADAADAADAK